MNLSGKTNIVLVVSGRRNRNTRIGSRFFNSALRSAGMLVIDPETNSKIIPSKDVSWVQVGLNVRAGKKTAARVEVAPKSRAKKSA